MIDYTSWLDSWDEWFYPPQKTVPLTAVELADNRHHSLIAVVLMGALTIAVLMFYAILKNNVALKATTLFGVVFMVLLGIPIVHPVTAKLVEEDVPEPLSFIAQTEKTFDVHGLSCPPDVMSSNWTELPDKGTYRCTVTDGKNGRSVRNVTLVVDGNNRVGLYDAQGKAVK